MGLNSLSRGRILLRLNNRDSRHLSTTKLTAEFPNKRSEESTPIPRPPFKQNSHEITCMKQYDELAHQPPPPSTSLLTSKLVCYLAKSL